ncbi:acyl-CoA dehydrogenase family protein [Streptomyces sp. NPDC093600]|uniref:acyl-CoA dehydrogenase family protein n=1 Tax=Streptomyces sp. NPDC093600 TaxID=3366047 RepID=UPI00380CE097
MHAAVTGEQYEIRRTLRDLRDLLAEKAGPGERRAAVASPEGYDTGLWHRMSTALGLPGLTLPQEYGGAGGGPAELALVCEETGRALAPSPLLATTVLGAPLITALGTAAQRAALLPSLVDTSLTCALAVPGGSLALALGLTGDNTDGAWAGGGRAGGVQARLSGGRWRLYGEAARVLDGHSAGLLLVAAHTGGFTRGRTLLFLVRGDAAGLRRGRQPALDATRPQATVQLRDAEGELLGEQPADVPGALAGVGRTAAVMLAAEAVGAARAALDRTVECVGTRERFGRPLGSLPAVEQRLPDLYVQVEAARSLTYHAAHEPAAGGTGGLALAAGLEALRAVAGEAVRLHDGAHGGTGSTGEHEAHLYVERATGGELLFGPVRALRARAAEGAGLYAVRDVPGADRRPGSFA